jgi:hypothetical protein
MGVVAICTQAKGTGSHTGGIVRKMPGSPEMQVPQPTYQRAVSVINEQGLLGTIGNETVEIVYGLLSERLRGKNQREVFQAALLYLATVGAIILVWPLDMQHSPVAAGLQPIEALVQKRPEA